MSEQTTISKCCVTGHIHEGQPLGNFEIVHGLRTYVSDPKPVSQGQKQDVVIFISDIFGVDLVNTKLVADSWAGQGSEWKVLLPDFLEKDAISHEHLKAIVPNLKQQAEATMLSKAADTAVMGAQIGPFMINRREAVVKPMIEKFVQAVRAEPSTGKIIAVGFCWGARYALLLANEDSPARVDVSINYHPSFVTNADIEKIKTVPVAIFKGTADAMMSDENLDEVEKLLKGNLGADKLLVKRYPDAVHGFSVRGDDNEPRERGYKEDGANEGIKFANRWVGQSADVKGTGI